MSARVLGSNISYDQLIMRNGGPRKLEALQQIPATVADVFLKQGLFPCKVQKAMTFRKHVANLSHFAMWWFFATIFEKKIGQIGSFPYISLHETSFLPLLVFVSFPHSLLITSKKNTSRSNHLGCLAFLKHKTHLLANRKPRCRIKFFCSKTRSWVLKWCEVRPLSNDQLVGG